MGNTKFINSSLLTLVLVLFSNLTFAALPNSPLSISFGIYKSDKAVDMYLKFKPLLETLQTKVSDELDRPVEIKLTIFRSYSDAIKALTTGKADFFRFGPASYILAKQKNEAIHLLAMELKNGKKRFNGLIVVQKDSFIKNLADLKGTRFAFGNKNSTIGRYLSQAELIKNGIFEKDLSKIFYLKRHDVVYNAVALGKYEAGALKESTFNKLNKTSKLRILTSFDNVTKPWVAQSNLDPNIIAALSKSLLSIKDKSILKIFKASGFVATNDEEYEFVRAGMTLSEKF